MRKAVIFATLIVLSFFLCSCRPNTEALPPQNSGNIMETTQPALPASDSVTVVVWKDDNGLTCYSLFDGDVTPAPTDLPNGRVYDDIAELNAALAMYPQDTVSVVYIRHAIDFTKEEASIWSDIISVPSANYSKVTGLYESPIITDYTQFLSSWKPLIDLPSDYSKEQAINDHIYVDIHGTEIYNQVLVDNFYMDVSNGIAAFMRTMQYTIEGDPIITDYQYDGSIFTVTTDISRDKYKGIESEDIFTDTYKYLVPLDRQRLGHGMRQPYLLSNEENIYTSTSGGEATLIDGLWQIPSPSGDVASPSIIAVSGDNQIPVNVYASQLVPPLSKAKGLIHYLNLDPALEWHPFSVFDNGEELLGYMQVYEAETLTELDMLRPSGLHLTEIIMQYLESGHSYIVTHSVGEWNDKGEVVGDIFMFGIIVP